MGIAPLLDYIVLKDIDPPVAPGKLHRINVDPTAPKYAEVVAVGPGRPSEYSGKTITYRDNVARPATIPDNALWVGSEGASPVKPGQTVVFHGGAGTVVKEPSGEETRWLLPRDIMGIVGE